MSGYRVPVPPEVAASLDASRELRLKAQFDLFREEILSELRPARVTGPTMREFWERWIREYARANRHKPRGIESKEQHLEAYLLPLFGEKRLGELRDQDVQALKGRFPAGRGGSPKTINNVLSTLNKLLKTAVKWRVIDEMPVRIEFLNYQPPLVPFYEFHQYEKLLYVASTFDDPRYLVVVLLGGDAGLRLSEKIGLAWPDIDFARNRLHIQRAVSHGHESLPKGGRARWVPMSRELARALERLKASKFGIGMLVLQKKPVRPAGPARPPGNVLKRDDGRQVSEQVLRTWIGKMQRQAGFHPTGRFHILRHTFCSHLAMRGEPLRVIMELAGHTSEKTTLRYMHLAPSDKDRAISNLDQARQGQTAAGPAQPDEGEKPSAGLPASPRANSMTLPGFEPGGRVAEGEVAGNPGMASPPVEGMPDSLALWRAELDVAQGLSPEGSPTTTKGDVTSCAHCRSPVSLLPGDAPKDTSPSGRSPKR